MPDHDRISSTSKSPAPASFGSLESAAPGCRRLPPLALAPALALALTLAPSFASAQAPNEAPEAAAANASTPNEPDPPSPPTNDGTDAESARKAEIRQATFSSLEALVEELRLKREELDERRAELSSATTPQERTEIGEALKSIRLEIDELDLRFEKIAALGIDAGEFSDETKESEANLQGELESLLTPLIRQLKGATKDVRLQHSLEETIERFTSLEDQATRALAGVNELHDNAAPGLRPHLEGARESWQKRLDQVRRGRDVAQGELARLIERKEETSMIDTARDTIDQFFRKKGLNLAVAIGAFLVVFLAFRFVHRTVIRPLRERHRTFPFRALNVVFYLLTFVASIGAVMIALAAMGDWTLLLIVILFLAGVGWASTRMLPQFFEQVRLLLNLGSVREGERLVFEGVPWQIDTLLFYSRLVNPALAGGRLRLPLRHLIGLHSRPMAENEPWFPTNEGDWVLLEDETRAKVIKQTPEMVEVRLPGGAEKNYPTAEFLAAAPQNISKGYRVEIRFGIDYAHQAECTDEIPRIFLERIERELPDVVPSEHIQKVQVTFLEAAASSLDYEIEADLDGAAAKYYERVERALARIAVEACNEHGWGIPFQQITLHQA